MQYVDADGTKQTPYVIHRSSIGCYERTLAFLIEKYAGAFPLWMSPVQVKVLNVTDRSFEYSEQLVKNMLEAGIRAELDCRNEKIGKKIREAQLEKVPYMLIIGDKEVEENSVSIRARKDGDLGSMSQQEFIAKVIYEDKTHKKD